MSNPGKGLVNVYSSGSGGGHLEALLFTLILLGIGTYLSVHGIEASDFLKMIVTAAIGYWIKTAEVRAHDGD